MATPENTFMETRSDIVFLGKDFGAWPLHPVAVK